MCAAGTRKPNDTSVKRNALICATAGGKTVQYFLPLLLPRFNFNFSVFWLFSFFHTWFHSCSHFYITCSWFGDTGVAELQLHLQRPMCDLSTVYDCFRTATLNLFRHYPKELHVNRQMSETVGPDINRLYPSSSLVKSLRNVKFSCNRAAQRIHHKQVGMFATFLSCDWHCFGVLETKHWNFHSVLFVSYLETCTLCANPRLNQSKLKYKPKCSQ